MLIRWIYCISLLILYSMDLSEGIISNVTIHRDLAELNRLNEVLKYNFLSNSSHCMSND